MTTKRTARLACTTTPDVARRLELTAVVRRTSQSDVATTLLDAGLPSAGELAGQLDELADGIRNGARNGHED